MSARSVAGLGLALALIAAAPARGDPARASGWAPPHRGHPDARVQNGPPRGARAVPQLRALAPRDPAFTARPSPSLFWLLDAPPAAADKLVFTLIDIERPEPIAEIELEAPTEVGLQRTRLSDFGLRLEEQRCYEWSVALVPDPLRRSHDRVAAGALRRRQLREAPAPAGDVADGSEGSSAAWIRARLREGYWYDAFEAWIDAMEHQPELEELRALHATLLQSAGLSPDPRALQVPATRSRPADRPLIPAASR